MKEKSNYVSLPVLRGFKEIECLWPIVQKHNAMICGGYARYCLSQDRNAAVAGDVDLFPQSDTENSALVEEIKALGFTIKHENEISITFNKLEEHADCRWIVTPTIQIIKPVIEGAIVTVGKMEDVLDNFDFTIVRCALISSEYGIADEDFVVDDKSKKIRIKNIHCPISSTLRCIKYSKKGYWLGAIETLKLFNDWTERGSDYRAQLIDLLGKMKNSDGSEPSQEDVDELEKLMNID